MIDGVIKNNGTSRMIKGTLPATYDAFRAAVAAGTQGLDVLFNEDGWTQQPTFLNKGNLLSDPTAAALSLEQDDPTVNDALLLVGQKLNAREIKLLFEGTTTTTITSENSITFSDALPKDLSNYSVIYIYFKTIAPSNGSGTITLYIGNPSGPSAVSSFAYQEAYAGFGCYVVGESSAIGVRAGNSGNGADVLAIKISSISGRDVIVANTSSWGLGKGIEFSVYGGGK